ncbi:MAG TPA: MOSC domain-containing protein [Actinomycetales bacterium]|nr:MOSC domain-containing protein [Actinomycetales bacterium]
MRITAINLHPVKSGAIRPVSAAPLDPGGLRDDRRWMVVDGDGEAVTARMLPELFRVVADTPVTDPAVTADLRLGADGQPPLDVTAPSGPPVRVTMFRRHRMAATLAAPDAHEWIRTVVGRADLRLVWCHDPSLRRLDPALASEHDHAAFPDNYPVTLASEASLARLNEWIGGDTPLPMSRFRPNIVVDGEEPFAEDSWSRLRLGPVGCRVVRSVDRCVMTTIDPTTLAKGPDPLRTLARHRRWDGKTWFARHLIPDGTGTVRVGDEVAVLSRTS